MRLIQNNVGIVQRTSSHVSQRRHFNQTFFCIVKIGFRPHDLIQGIVQRAKVGVNLTLEISRQKSQLFSCLNSRTGQDNPPYFAVFKGLDRHRHGKIRLSRTSRSDSKYNHFLADLIHILFLSYRLWLYRTAGNGAADNVLVNF